MIKRAERLMKRSPFTEYIEAHLQCFPALGLTKLGPSLVHGKDIPHTHRISGVFSIQGT